MNKRRILASFLAISGLVGFLALWQFSMNKEKAFIIRPFNQETDFEPLRVLINDNLFMLSENPDFATEKFLLWRAPNFDPSKKGQTTIQVAEKDNQVAGFISYHRKAANQGYIWILGVDEKFRGQGMGESLTRFALDDFKKMKVDTVSISTRTINQPAIKLYKKLGFKEIYRDDKRGIISLVKRGL